MCQIDGNLFPAMGIDLQRSGTTGTGCAHCGFPFRRNYGRPPLIHLPRRSFPDDGLFGLRLNVNLTRDGGPEDHVIGLPVHLQAQVLVER